MNFSADPNHSLLIVDDRNRAVALATSPVWRKVLLDALNAAHQKQFRFNHKFGNDGPGHKNAICVQTGPISAGFIPIRFLHDGVAGEALPSELTPVDG